ncbi:hypothetical protein HGB13_01430, partial [bacterium]|nr:hypothetical protein [bacterium]
MVTLSRDELIKELEDEAEKIHNSTRVDIPLFSPMHNYFRSRSETYYKWSIAPKSNNIHKTTAIGFIFSVFFFTLIQFVFPNLFVPKVEDVFASSNSETWSTNSQFGTGTLDANGQLLGDNSGSEDTNGRIQLKTTGALGSGADGELVVDGVTAANNTLNGSVITGGPFNAANPLVLDIKIDKPNNTYNFTNITLQNNAVLTHSVRSAAKGGVEGIEIFATGVVTINSGSSIDVSGKSTKTTGTSGSLGDGGGYGNVGGASRGAGGPSYGDASSVASMGSKGSNASTGALGGNGGGRIKLYGDILNVNGSILANGFGGTGINSNFGATAAGGGSGGGIILSSNTLSVTGNISAAGGGGGGSGSVSGGNGMNGIGGTGGWSAGYGSAAPGGGVGHGGAGGVGAAVGFAGGASAGGGGGGFHTNWNALGGGGGASGRVAIFYKTISQGYANATSY